MTTRLAFRPTEQAQAVPVLMYHSIGARGARRFRRFVTSPEQFARQMDYLAAAGYRPITAAELSRSRAAGLPLHPMSVVLTFDDAYADFYTAALPVLRDHHFPATLYVPTGYVGGTSRWMTSLGEADREILSWSALEDIAAEGVELGAHSHSHPQLDCVAATAIRDEVVRSKHVLEDRIGTAVTGFAYPFGYCDRRARCVVAEAGFSYACVVDDLVTTPADDLLRIPRLTVNAGTDAGMLARLLAARPTRTRRSLAAAKGIAWRTVRRHVPALGGKPTQGAA